MAPSNVMRTGSIITWSSSAPDLRHRISVCRAGTSDCLSNSCTNCGSISITGITEGDNNITVCSSSVVNGVPCMGEACAHLITEGML